MKTSLQFFVIFFLLINIQFCPAQENGKEIVIGKSYFIHSDILSEDRPYIVYTPDNYSEDKDPVSVMYLLDGDGHFHHTSGIVSYLQERNRIPDMMIIAIPNTGERTRDLTPAIELDEESKKNMPMAGGADKMLEFISTELIPHIEEQYNTNDYKMLVGHSFGGLFAVNTLLTKPELFDSYIAISPSMWWDKQNLYIKAQEFFKDKPELDAYFYMTMGNEDREMLGGAMKLAALFEENKSDQFQSDFKVMKEETHGTIPHRSTYYGLEKIFKDWYQVNLPELYVSGGMKSIDEHYASLTKKLGYKLEPSEADLNNLGYQLLQSDQQEKAIEIFNINVERNPSSANVYDSRGEAYKAMGEKEKSIDDYLKSLKLNPGNQNAIDMLKSMEFTYDQDKLIKKVKPKELLKYVGNYRAKYSGNDILLIIESVDGALKAHAENTLPLQKLVPYGDHVFLAKESNLPMIFGVDKNKNVINVSIQTGITDSLTVIKEK